MHEKTKINEKYARVCTFFLKSRPLIETRSRRPRASFKFAQIRVNVLLVDGATLRRASSLQLFAANDLKIRTIENFLLN